MGIRTMRITDVQTVLLSGPASEDPYLTGLRDRRSAAFIEVQTTSGLVGLGETYAGYFCPEVVPTVVEFYKPVLVGQDPSDPDELWRRMYRCGSYWGRVGLGPAVLTGIEAALWDLKGKITGRPVYELLGGKRHESILCYASGNTCEHDRLGEMLDFYFSLGFCAVKLGVGSFSKAGGLVHPSSTTEIVDQETGKLEFIRTKYGRDIPIMLDGHMETRIVRRWDLSTAATILRALEPYNLFFFEEPLPYTDPWGYAELARQTAVPIAGGECLTTAYEWRVFAEQGSFDIAQPDASFVGGLREFLRVAEMFTGGRRIATHSWGAGASFMQNLHCAFACPNTAIIEVAPALGSLHREIMGDSFVMKNGMALPPEAPGLGIELSENTKNAHPFVAGTGEFTSVPGRVMAP
jgi:galactonate dehydratase